MYTFNSFSLAGITDFYVFSQISLWRMFHTLGLCWSIVFPFHYRRFKTEGRIKHIHVSTVVLGLVLPSIPALLPLIDGYVIIPGQHHFCTGSNVTIIFFIVVFPVSILVATSTTMLVIIFWKIFKVN